MIIGRTVRQVVTLAAVVLATACGPSDRAPRFDPIADQVGFVGSELSVIVRASDPDADALMFAKSAGPAWLSVAANGTLSGTPGAGDVGLNSFTVSVSDGRGGSDSATLQTTVTAPVAAPSNLSVTAL